MYGLETEILTPLFSGHPQGVRRRDPVPSSEIGITVVSYIQSLQGRFQFLLKAATGAELLRAQSLLDLTKRSLSHVETVLPIDAPAASEFDHLRRNKRLKKIG